MGQRLRLWDLLWFPLWTGLKFQLLLSKTDKNQTNFNHRLNDKRKPVWYSNPGNQEQLLLQKGKRSWESLLLLCPIWANVKPASIVKNMALRSTLIFRISRIGIAWSPRVNPGIILSELLKAACLEWDKRFFASTYGQIIQNRRCMRWTSQPLIWHRPVPT